MQLIINHLWPLDTHLSASINPLIVMTIKNLFLQLKLKGMEHFCLSAVVTVSHNKKTEITVKYLKAPFIHGDINLKFIIVRLPKI